MRIIPSLLIGSLLASYRLDARITAMEVDKTQHAINVADGDLPNAEFVEGGAQALPAADARFDIGQTFKSLPHAPHAALDASLPATRPGLAPAHPCDGSGASCARH